MSTSRLPHQNQIQCRLLQFYFNYVKNKQHTSKWAFLLPSLSVRLLILVCGCDNRVHFSPILIRFHLPSRCRGRGITYSLLIFLLSDSVWKILDSKSSSFLAKFLSVLHLAECRKLQRNSVFLCPDRSVVLNEKKIVLTCKYFVHDLLTKTIRVLMNFETLNETNQQSSQLLTLHF